MRMVPLFEKRIDPDDNHIVTVKLWDNHPRTVWVHTTDGGTPLTVQQAQDYIGMLLEALKYLKDHPDQFQEED